MKNKEPKKTAKPAADEKAGIAKIVDEILSGCSTVPDTTLLFSKIRELERSAIDYASIVSKRFGKSTIAEQAFMINHLFPHLKKFSLSESLNSVVQKESFAPQVLVDILHYLIRSDTIIDSNLLQSAVYSKGGPFAADRIPSVRPWSEPTPPDHRAGPRQRRGAIVFNASPPAAASGCKPP